MKKLTVLLLLIMITQLLNAQSVKETMITDNAGKNINNVYDFKYDRNSGTYVYNDYDTVTFRSRLLSNKGNSASYTYTGVYDVFFDNSGNYYATASNNITETTSKYYLLKNGQEIRSFDNLNFPVKKSDDGIYFIAQESGKEHMVKYNFVSGNFDMGTGYDTIYACYMNPDDKGSDVVYEIGFTKDGAEFYIACKNGKQMIVVGGAEMKEYDEILYRSAFLDNNGKVCYVAKQILTRENYFFLVQDGKEYKKFTDISSYNVVFDKNNIPYYAASDERAEYPSTQFLVKGNEVISRKFNRGIYDISISPSGNPAYCGTDTLKDGSSMSYLFVDGKEAAKYPVLYGVKYFPDNTYAYIATDKEDKSFVVHDGKVVSGKFTYISNLEINKKGELSYIATNYGDYEKNIPDATTYFIGKEKFGPYKGMQMGEMGPPPIVYTDDGDFSITASQDVAGLPEEKVKYYVKNKNWASDAYDYITDINAYKKDFYFAGNNYKEDGTGIFQFYKNNKPLGEKYQSAGNVQLDKEKGIVTFTGIRGNTIYFVEIKLND